MQEGLDFYLDVILDMHRSCLHLSLSSSHLRIDASSQESSTVSPHKRKKKLSEKQMTMPAVLTEMKARDRSAQISGYLFTHKSKTKRWKKRWYVVYNLVLYEFVRHEVGIAEHVMCDAVSNM